MSRELPPDSPLFRPWLAMVSARAMWHAGDSLQLSPPLIERDWRRYQDALADLVRAEELAAEHAGFRDPSRQRIVRGLVASQT